MDVLLTNVRPMGGETIDLAILNGRIAASASMKGPVTTIDGKGAILLPGLIEAHTHMDKTFSGLPWVPHRAGSRIEQRILNDRDLKRELKLDAAQQSANQVLAAVATGTTHFRTHVDVDTEIGLRNIEGVLATRERYAHLVDIEIVAFPQSGLLVRPGTAELLDEAMRMGADLVGGLDPCAIERDPKGHVDLIFKIAQRHGKGLDVHLHEPGTMGAFSMELMLERVKALGMQGMLTVSHAFCLGAPDEPTVARLIEELVVTDTAIITTAPASAPVPPVKRLLQAGVRVGGGNDGVRDAWTPWCNNDMLERAMLIAMRNGFRGDEDIALAVDACTTGAAAVMRLAGYGIATGSDADLVLVEAGTLAEAVALRPKRSLVMKRGQITARNGEVMA